MAYEHGNWDYDHNKDCQPTRKLAYSMYDRKHYASAKWASDRKQNTSSKNRRAAMRSANKHTRQMLKAETNEELQLI